MLTRGQANIIAGLGGLFFGLSAPPDHLLGVTAVSFAWAFLVSLYVKRT